MRFPLLLSFHMVVDPRNTQQLQIGFACKEAIEHVHSRSFLVPMVQQFVCAQRRNMTKTKCGRCPNAWTQRKHNRGYEQGLIVRSIEEITTAVAEVEL